MRRRPARVSAPRSGFAGFGFPPEVITLAVRSYLRFGLSYRDVEELVVERGIEVDRSSLVHTSRDDLATSIHTATSMASTARRPRTLCSPMFGMVLACWQQSAAPGCRALLNPAR